jgi:hypothetical protein
MELRASLPMFAYRLDCQIDVSGGFDRYPTGRDLAILGLPLAVKLRGEMLVVRMGHRLWGGDRCPIRGTQRQLAIGTCRHHLPMVRVEASSFTDQAASTRSAGLLAYARLF